MVDLTSYIMMLKSAQFSSLKHVVDFARVVGTATDRELGTRSNTSGGSKVQENFKQLMKMCKQILPYRPTMVSHIERLL